MAEHQDQCVDCDHNHKEEFDVKKHVFLTAVSLILFVCGLIFNRQVHSTPAFDMDFSFLSISWVGVLIQPG